MMFIGVCGWCVLFKMGLGGELGARTHGCSGAGIVCFVLQKSGMAGGLEREE